MPSSWVDRIKAYASKHMMDDLGLTKDQAEALGLRDLKVEFENSKMSFRDFRQAHLKAKMTKEFVKQLVGGKRKALSTTTECLRQ